MNTPFPTALIEHCSDFAAGYFATLAEAVGASDLKALDRIAALLKTTIDNGNLIFICGNGGSAGIANHALCDFLKCARTDTNLLPRVMSLSAHTEMNSALANDISYDEVFAYQVQSMGREDDVLITVSSSGDSENVVRALQAARENGLRTVSFTGFAGGRTRDLADLNAHANAHNYGVVEDMHMAFIHILTQYLRMQNMDEDLIGQRKF